MATAAVSAAAMAARRRQQQLYQQNTAYLRHARVWSERGSSQWCSDAALVRCGVERVAGGFGKLIVVLSLNHWYRSHLNFEFAGNCEVQRVVLRGDGAGGALPLTLTRLHRSRKSYCSCSRSH